VPLSCLDTAVYRPRRPRTSPLWRILDEHFERFLDVYPERYQHKLGFLPEWIPDRIEAYLKCGVLDWGFALYTCDTCHKQLLVGYSCKIRNFCPSCQAKRQAEFAEFLTEEILEFVPHRHITLTVPRRIRPFFSRDRKLLSILARSAWDTVKSLLQEGTGEKRSTPGAVVAVHTAGSLLDWHPHVHMLVSWGTWDRDGTFHHLHDVPRERIVEELFRHHVLSTMMDRELLSDEVVRSMLSWANTGFGAHIGEPIIPPPEQLESHDSEYDSPEPRHELCSSRSDTILKYLVRAPIAIERTSITPQGQVMYRADRIHPRHRSNFRVFDPRDFIAQLVLHIPAPRQRLTTYYGWYSNRSRGARNKKEKHEPQQHQPHDEDPDASTESRRAWARMIKRVYEIDPLVCPHCGDKLSLRSFVDSEGSHRRRSTGPATRHRWTRSARAHHRTGLRRPTSERIIHLGVNTLRSGTLHVCPDFARLSIP
jgi:hypothetical protein